MMEAFLKQMIEAKKMECEAFRQLLPKALSEKMDDVAECAFETFKINATNLCTAVMRSSEIKVKEEKSPKSADRHVRKITIEG
ncbi:MAG: hypothetical protein RR614_00900 [Eubacterium sp.]